MSKFSCRCGHIIRDNTDFISYKGYYIADQDFHDLADELETASRDETASVLIKYLREMYQCENCHAIFMFPDSQHFHTFNATGPDSSHVLESCRSDRWSGFLRGYYSTDKSEVYWVTNAQSDFVTGLTQDDAEALYYRKFAELHATGILRSAFLTINGTVVHRFDDK